MPTRRCCCGDCLTFTDIFDREDNDNIGPDYEECSGNFEIVSNELVGTGSLVILKSKGVPYGYLFCGFEVIQGVTYEFGAYRGTLLNPCAGSSSVILKVDCLAPDSGYAAKVRLELLGGVDKGYVEYQAVTWTSEDTLFLMLCIGKDGVIAGRPSGAWTETAKEDPTYIDPLTDCTSTLPTGLYFDIETYGSSDGVIREINYSEHFDAYKNPNCRRCIFGNCFGYGDVPIGWKMTLSGITDGECAECPSEITADVYIEDSDNPCSSEFQSEVVVVPTECTGPIIPPGIPSNAYFSLSWDLDCADPDELVITWNIAFNGVPVTVPFTITKTYPKAAGVSLTKAKDLKFSSQPADTPVDCTDSACCMGGTLTVEPILLEGCCYDPLEP